MDVLRTPEDRFAGLPDFDYPARYAEIEGGLRMAYVEAGPADGEPIVLLHGEPSWSFLYRHVIAELVEAGYRAIAPDLIGFGRSDKPAEVTDHSYARHIDWTGKLLFDALDLHGMTLVGQDWGGLIGLRLVAAEPDRFARVVAANTGLPTGDHGMPDAWWAFKNAVAKAERLDIARFVQSGCRTTLSDEVRAAYDAPFPDERYKAGPRAMPGLVPATPDNVESEPNRQAWQKLTTLDIPWLCAFSDSDPITGPMGPILQRAMRGAAGVEHPVIAGAGHFLQEDAGHQLGQAVVEFARAHPRR